MLFASFVVVDKKKISLVFYPSTNNSNCTTQVEILLQLLTMATSTGQENFKFRARRATKVGNITPGILIWADKYEMICHIKHQNKSKPHVK